MKLRLDRRYNRSDNLQQALDLQLAATAKRADFNSIVLADELGLLVACAGDAGFCERLAAISPKLTKPGHVWHGSIKTKKSSVRVNVAPISWGDDTLYVAATKGEKARIPLEMFKAGRGVIRILG